MYPLSTRQRRRRDCEPFAGEAIVDRLAARAAVPHGRWAFHVRLTEAVDGVMRRGRRGHPCLRHMVFELTRRADAAGVTRDEVRRALADFISEHPLCCRLDRVCLADSQRTSDHLIELVERWVAGA